MPTSFIHAVPHIVGALEACSPESVLDVGIGFGKYGVILREVLEVSYGRYFKEGWKVLIDGIEAFEEYHNPIHDFVYNRVYYEDMEVCLPSLPVYDVVLLIDVLERFEKEKGKKIIQNLLQHARKSLLVSTPRFPAKQDSYLGNSFELHRSRWHILDFVDFDFAYCYFPLGNNGAQVFQIFPSISHRCLSVDNVLFEATLSPTEKILTIGFFLPHKYLTGGMKILLDYLVALSRRGHRIVIFFRGEDEKLPEWYARDGFKPWRNIAVPNGKSLQPLIKDLDILVAGFFTQLEELQGLSVPVVLFEQGSEYLFGDYGDLHPHSPVRQLLWKAYTSPVPIITVSPLLEQILRVRFGRKALVVPNGVDINFYHPGSKGESNTILLVGNPALPFKGFDVAFLALQKAWNVFPHFRVIWACQQKPNVRGISFPLSFVLVPSQEELASLYRQATVLLFTSWYEGFGLPPLEAMASGTAVVATDCGGIRTYAWEGENVLLAEPGDVDSLAYALLFLLQNPVARKIMEQRGREVALDFSIEKSVMKFEEALYRVINVSNYLVKR
ncbi:MAG: glycosyltransferase family 4 protein [Candidatus Atribacteria bacterium]|nr:glycosyltransferase family 4 protein [Candidatus Atribacteria bacterium]